MEENQKVKTLRPKEYYRERIVKIVSEIQSEKILGCIYVFVSDISKEDLEV